MPARTHLNMNDSETLIVHAASRIFSAFVAGNQVIDDEEAMIEKSIALAVRIAQRTDALVYSDDDLGNELTGK